MSTGFSGNIGFPIPYKWNYGQFHEISGYHGKWDLDRVAYLGRVTACSTVCAGSSEGYKNLDFPDLVGALENRFEELRVILQTMRPEKIQSQVEG